MHPELPPDEVKRQFYNLRRRGLLFVPRKFPRTYVPRVVPSKRDGLFMRALVWLLPWRQREYPGQHRGIAEALQGHRKPRTILAYIKGTRRMPEEVAEMLAGLLRARVEAGQALLAELEAYAARQSPERRRQRQGGIMRVDPVTGLSGRSDVGKRRAVKDV